MPHPPVLRLCQPAVRSAAARRAVVASSHLTPCASHLTPHTHRTAPTTGTHCAGIMAAEHNSGPAGRTPLGAANSARLLSCRFMDFLGSGYTSDAAECIRRMVDAGASVISNRHAAGCCMHYLDQLRCFLRLPIAVSCMLGRGPSTPCMHLCPSAQPSALPRSPTHLVAPTAGVVVDAAAS